MSTYLAPDQDQDQFRRRLQTYPLPEQIMRRPNVKKLKEKHAAAVNKLVLSAAGAATIPHGGTCKYWLTNSHGVNIIYTEQKETSHVYSMHAFSATLQILFYAWMQKSIKVLNMNIPTKTGKFLFLFCVYLQYLSFYLFFESRVRQKAYCSNNFAPIGLVQSV